MSVNARGNLPSNNISVFPTTRRLGKSAESRFLSEHAISRIVNTLIDCDGFIITKMQLTDSGSIKPEYYEKPFEFNIHGYYFCIEKLRYLMDSFSSMDDGTSIYAEIEIDTKDGKETELIGSDDSNGGQETESYSGVKFYVAPTTGSGRPSSNPPKYCLQLFNKRKGFDGTDIYEPSDDAVSKFSVDGGEIR